MTQERRLVPRYSFTMDVTVCRDNGSRFAARTSDVSLNGMGLHMAHAAVLALAQGGTLLTPGDRFEIVLSPNDDEVDGVIGPRLGSRVRHVRRLSQQEFLVGVQFEELDGGQRASLQAIVERAQADRLR